MDRIKAYNPFAARTSHDARSILAYKVLTTVTWLLAAITSVYYTVYVPHDGFHIGHSIPDTNTLYPTAFTINNLFIEIYWSVLFILQAGYIGHLFSSNAVYVNAAASVGSHFILHNLFHFAFVMLFVYGHFIWAELIIFLNFTNLTFLYFGHNTYPRFIHWPVVSAPLAWYFVALYWNGAIMVPHPNHLVARIFANVFVWSILVYGAFFIVVYKDYTMGFSLSVLSAGIGVAQFFSKIIAFQWIFAFIIMSLLFLATVGVAVPAWRAQGGILRPADTERAPLLAEH